MGEKYQPRKVIKPVSETCSLEGKINQIAISGERICEKVADFGDR
jgi:hypothetical protein